MLYLAFATGGVAGCGILSQIFVHSAFILNCNTSRTI